MTEDWTLRLVRLGRFGIARALYMHRIRPTKNTKLRRLEAVGSRPEIQ